LNCMMMQGLAKFKDEDICMAAVGFTFLALHVPKGEKNKKRFWLSPTPRGGKI